jgi:hypothetical protein
MLRTFPSDDVSAAAELDELLDELDELLDELDELDELLVDVLPHPASILATIVAVSKTLSTFFFIPNSSLKVFSIAFIFIPLCGKNAVHLKLMYSLNDELCIVRCTVLCLLSIMFQLYY